MTMAHEEMDLEATGDLEAGLLLPLLVGDSYDQPLQNLFQEEEHEGLPKDQKRPLLLWSIVANVTSVIMFDSALTTSAKTVAMFFFITAGNAVLVSGVLVGKFYSHRAFLSIVRLYSWVLFGALVVFWTC